MIQAKPQARRALLEEAAGISGLHSRRHEAELRLRAAETNLERLEDVVGELGTQIESLKRQSRQANRFRSLSADIRAAEAILLHLRWSQAKAQEGEAQSALSTATSHVGAMAQAQMIAAKEQAIAAQHLPELRDQQASAAAVRRGVTDVCDDPFRPETLQGRADHRHTFVIVESDELTGGPSGKDTIDTGIPQPLMKGLDSSEIHGPGRVEGHEGSREEDGISC